MPPAPAGLTNYLTRADGMIVGVEQLVKLLCSKAQVTELRYLLSAAARTRIDRGRRLRQALVDEHFHFHATILSATFAEIGRAHV